MEAAGAKLGAALDWMKSGNHISAPGSPAVTVPDLFTVEGLAGGRQIVGRNQEEWSVPQMALEFEAETVLERAGRRLASSESRYSVNEP